MTSIKLSNIDKDELKQYLIDEAEYTESEVNEMDSTELLDSWLQYNGIIGYTDDIKDVIEAAFDVDLED